MTPLAAAKELVTVLEQQQALATRQGELLGILGYPGPTISAQLDKAKAKRGKAKVGDKVTWPDGTKGEVVLVEDMPPMVEGAMMDTGEFVPKERSSAKADLGDSQTFTTRTSAEILADDGMGHRTPEEQAKIESEAMSVYDANVDPATNKQKAMIFAMLASDFNVQDNAEQKAVIVGIIEQLHGVKIDKISEELSKAWAGDTIDWLIKAKPADVSKWIVPF